MKLNNNFDFGGATIILESSVHGKLVIAGQKSGFLHAIDAKTGKLVWQTRVGRGGIQGGIHFGIGARGETVFVPISDMEDGKTSFMSVKSFIKMSDIDIVHAARVIPVNGEHALSA